MVAKKAVAEAVADIVYFGIDIVSFYCPALFSFCTKLSF